jgi:predicted nucleic acid-binding protein
VTILPFTSAEAEKAAEIRAILKSQGKPIGAYDVLIAGHGNAVSLPRTSSGDDYRQPKRIQSRCGSSN